MILRYAKILLLTMLALIQTACPQYAATPHTDVRGHAADDYRSDSGDA
jgi:hypothetical protein